MNARLALLCVAVAGCRHPTRATCDLDRGAIAGWLVTSKFGVSGDLDAPPNAPTSAVALRWREEYGGVLFMLDNPGVTEWCAARERSVDNACWTPAGDTRAECLAARADLEDIAIGGPLCGFELKAFAIDGLVSADGIRPAIGDAAAFQAYDTAAREYWSRLDDVPWDRICTEIGGLFIRCYRNADDPRCEQILARVRRYLPTD